MAIKNITVAPEEITDSTAWVAWDTDAGEESTYDGVRFGEGALNQDTGEALNGSGSVQHRIQLTGLAAGTTYLAQPHSRLTTARNPLPYAVGDGTVSFSTLSKGGPAKSVDIQAPSVRPVVGQDVEINVTCLDGDGKPANNSQVHFAIHNGADRGTFSANPAGTDGNGKATTRFTPAKNGKAQIQIRVDTVSAGLDLIVN